MTHVHHLQHAGYYNGEGKFVPARMTILSEVKGDEVHYQVAFCSRHDQYNKKVGRELAAKAPVFSTKIPEKTFAAISDAVIVDLVTNHKDVMPNIHRTLAEMIEDHLISTDQG